MRWFVLGLFSLVLGCGCAKPKRKDLYRPGELIPFDSCRVLRQRYCGVQAFDCVLKREYYCLTNLIVKPEKPKKKKWKKKKRKKPGQLKKHLLDELNKEIMVGG